MICDSNRLREVHDEWERHSARTDSDINWEARAVVRESMSGLAVEQAKERLQHFLERKNVFIVTPAVKSVAREHRGRLVNDFDKAKDHHAAAHELASEAKARSRVYG
jgi:hypothetical protein